MANIGRKLTKGFEEMTTDRLMMIFTAIIAAMAVLQLLVFLLQAYVMSGQRSTMKDQLDEMVVTREKLSQLVTQAAQNAAAGQASAMAAKQSADVIMNSERAWIMANVQKNRSESAFAIESRNSASPFPATTLYLELKCKNEGRSPAWIIEKRGRVVVADSNYPPMEPDLQNTDHIEVKLQPISPQKEIICNWFPQFAGSSQAEPGHHILIFGAVKYRDIFGVERETRFGYRVTDNQFGAVERLVDRPKFNQST